MRKLIWALMAVLSLAGTGRAEMVIAALGDSLTQGYGLAPEAGFVPQMEAWLRDQGADVRLINAGVSGDTTAGGAARIGWTLGDEVDGLIVALGGNDILRGIDPALARANLETILQEAERTGVPVLLIGVRVPSNYGAEYKAAFEAIYPDLAASYGTLWVEDFFVGLMGDSADLAEISPYLQPDGLHPGPEGVRRIVAGLGPSVLDLIVRAGP